MKKIISKSSVLIAGILASVSLYAGSINTAKESGTTMVCPTITITVAPTSVLCYGGSTGTAVANASGGTAPYTFSWNTGSTKDSIGNLAVGIYTVTATDTNGCVATATVGISEPAQLKLNAAAFPVSCNGACNGSASVILSGGTSPFNFTWSNGQQTASINNLCPGTYSVVVTDANKCIADTTLWVASPTAVVANAFASPSVICIGNSSLLSDSATGGTAPYKYSWVPGGNTTSSLSVSPAATTTYTLSVVDYNGCNAAPVTVVLQVNPLPSAGFTASNVCSGTPTVFTNTSTGATSFNWDPGDGTTNSTATDPTHTYWASGTFNVQLIATSANGCSDTITLPVTVNPNPVAVFISNSVCLGNLTQFNDMSTIAAPGIINSWSWKFGDPASGVSSAPDPAYTYAMAGAYSVTLTLTSNNGCVGSVVDTVIVIPSPVLTVSAGGSICAGSSVTLSAAGAVTYLWSPFVGCATCQSTNASPTVTTTYTVIGTNAAGCSSSAAIVVHVINASAAFTYSGVCSGNTIAFTDESTGGIVSWNWNFGNGATSTLQNPTHTFATDGMYNVSETVTSDSGCTATVSSPVGVYPGNGFDLTGSLQVCVDTPSVSNASIQACIFNNKCQVVKGTMKLLLDTAFHITHTISDSVAHVSGDTLIWNYVNLSDTGMIHCVSLTGNISSVPAGDSIFTSLFITPVAGDSNTSNNSITYWIKPSVTNCVGLPFDPNGKSVLPEGDISTKQLLSYTIHFQNTGTAVAKNVVVIDTLSPYVDPTTLRITSSSSEVVTTITSGHIVKFTFNNIDLPDTAKSKTSSIGIIEYTIYPMSTDVGGDVIKNGAGIYFDANPVVKTNTTVSTIVTKAVSVENINTPSFNIKCFPNPFTSATSVVFNTDGKHYLEVDDMTGRTLEAIECTGKQYELSGNNLAKGVYFIKAFNADRNNIAVTKVVLQ